MGSTAAINIPSMDGELAYPRKNGGPVFGSPWQSRAFGMVVNLHTSGLYPWDDFKSQLIAEIAADRDGMNGEQGAAYYESWVNAFSRLLVDRHLVGQDEIASRIEEYKSGARRQVF
jgi:nitrile hydratase